MTGNESGWSGERLAIPAAAVASLQQRQLNRVRTTLGVVIGVGIAVAAILAGRTSNTDPGPVFPPPPTTGQ